MYAFSGYENDNKNGHIHKNKAMAYKDGKNTKYSFWCISDPMLL